MVGFQRWGRWLEGCLTARMQTSLACMLVLGGFSLVAFLSPHTTNLGEVHICDSGIWSILSISCKPQKMPQRRSNGRDANRATSPSAGRLVGRLSWG